MKVSLEELEAYREWREEADKIENTGYLGPTISLEDRNSWFDWKTSLEINETRKD